MSLDTRMISARSDGVSHGTHTNESWHTYH